MSRLTTLTGVAALLLATTFAVAHTPSQPPHQLFNEGDLKLESGEVINVEQSTVALHKGGDLVGDSPCIKRLASSLQTGHSAP